MSIYSLSKSLLIFLLLLCAVLLTSTNAAVNTPSDLSQQNLPVHWCGSQRVDIDNHVSKQASPRIWVLKTQSDWSAFCKMATWHQVDVSPNESVDFSINSVVVFNNVKFVNQMSLADAKYDKSSRSLAVRLRETRTARPIVSQYYFVAIVVPKNIASVTDGATRWVPK